MAQKKKTVAKKEAEVPFETSLENLRFIVSEMESGQLTLTESLEKYEQGIHNLKQCFAALEKAQRKIELLVNLDDDGNLVTQPFNDEATFREPDSARTSPSLDEDLDPDSSDSLF